MTAVRNVLDRASVQPFVNLGEFACSVRNAARMPSQTDVRLLWGNDNYRAVTGLGETLDSEGGFLAPPELSERLLANIYDGDVLSRCTRTPAGSNEVVLPSIDETSRVDGSRWGGLRGYWVDEAEAVTATTPKLQGLRMKLRRVAVAVYATDELAEDVVSFGPKLEQIAAAELRFKIEDSIINGDGLRQPLGIMHSPARIEVSKETGQSADTLTITNTAAMYARMSVGSRRRAVWLCGGDADSELAQLAHGVGASTALTSEGGQRYLHGRPILPIEYAATLGDGGDIVFADLSAYEIVDRGGPKMARSVHVKFLEEESVFRFSYRINGQPSWKSALTPYKGTNTQSPFVTLEARA